MKRRYGDDLRHETVAKLMSVAERYGEAGYQIGAPVGCRARRRHGADIRSARIDQLDGILDAWNKPASEEAMSEVRAIADEFQAVEPMNYPPQSGQAGVTLTRTA